MFKSVKLESIIYNKFKDYLNVDSETSFNKFEKDFKSIIDFNNIKFDNLKKDISGQLKMTVKLSDSQLNLLFKEVSNGYLRRYLDYGNPRETDLLLISPFNRDITLYYKNNTKEISIIIHTHIQDK